MKMKHGVPYLFLLPALAGLLTFRIYPVLNAAWASLFQASFQSPAPVFAGLANYRALLADPVFWQSLRVTLLFNVLVDPLIIAGAFGLAVLLNQRLKGRALFRAIQFVPVAVSVPTACVLWSIMLSPEQGVINSILTGLGLAPQPFLNSADQALPGIVGIVAWKNIGYWAIFMLAGLQEVPKPLYEASSIDGASPWQQFRNVTFPLMKRPLTFVTVSVTVSNFLLFSPMYMLTGGGPRQSTNTLMLESFNSAFQYSDRGRSSAIVMMLLLVTVLVIAAQFRFLRAKH